MLVLRRIQKSGTTWSKFLQPTLPPRHVYCFSCLAGDLEEEEGRRRC